MPQVSTKVYPIKANTEQEFRSSLIMLVRQWYNGSLSNDDFAKLADDLSKSCPLVWTEFEDEMLGWAKYWIEELDYYGLTEVMRRFDFLDLLDLYIHTYTDVIDSSNLRSPITSCKQITLTPKRILEIEKVIGKEATERVRKNSRDVLMYQLKYLCNSKESVGYIAFKGNIKDASVLIYTPDYKKLTSQDLFSDLVDYALAGFFVMAPQYSDPNQKNPDENNDLDSILILKEIATQFTQADSKRTYMLGYGRGGYLVYLASSKVDWINSAVTIGGTTQTFKDKGSESDQSLYNSLNKKTNFLIIHGLDDSIVSPLESIRLAEKLYSIRKDFRLVLIENDNHNLDSHRKKVQAMVIDWFRHS